MKEHHREQVLLNMVRTFGVHRETKENFSLDHSNQMVATRRSDHSSFVRSTMA